MHLSLKSTTTHGNGDESNTKTMNYKPFPEYGIKIKLPQHKGPKKNLKKSFTNQCPKLVKKWKKKNSCNEKYQMGALLNFPIKTFYFWFLIILQKINNK